MVKVGFDKEKYLKLQSEHILERIQKFGNKLYLEFGGKLFDDFHASRVLPGFAPDSKIKMLLQLKESAEIVIVINASDIEKNKVRGDLGITYDVDVLRLIDAFRAIGLYVGSVVIAQFAGQPTADAFRSRLETLGVQVYLHYPIAGYPSNIPLIVSDDGYGKNQYIETSRPLVVVTAPGPGSGKMAVCLAQLYHEHKRGIKAGYAKFETFPIWNLPLKHPVNLAYEAATADLNDVNMIDPFHLESYGVTTVNYNRDVEVFPVLNAIFQQIAGESPYKSPTDMGVNQIAAAIVDDEAVREASCQEIIRRYLKAAADYKRGAAEIDTLHRLQVLMETMNLRVEDRAVVLPAREYLAKVKERLGTQEGVSAVAIQLDDGTVITGRNSQLMSAAAAAILNAAKHLGNIPDDILLLPPIIIQPILNLKSGPLKMKNCHLGAEEILMALSISAVTNPTAQAAMERLGQLDGCQAHSTSYLTRSDEKICSKLGLDVTCDPEHLSESLFYI